MSKVILDEVLRAKLNGLHEQVELCDESGQTVGHFLPADAYKKLFYAALAAECPHSAKELERRHQAEGGRSLAEIWKSLGRT
jgi:hypothetical protein